MKLFWKLFCSMVIITVLSCSLGGYVLIDQQFRTSLSREVSALYEENDLLRYALARELESYPAAVDRETLESLFSGIRITTGRGSAATRQIAEGKLDQRIPVTGDDELGQLSADFNAMAARLETHVRELQDAARRQEDFIGSFAHEIKTPLTSIIGYADLLRSVPTTPEQVLRSAGYIFSEGRRLETLSRKLMDLIVLEKQSISLRPVPMDAFLRRVGGALRPALEASGIRLTVRADAARIPADADLLESVCLNLLDNARKAMDGGGTAALEGLTEEGGYCIRLTDSGKGIPAAELSRITEAFYMVDKSRARAQGGAGLGLAVCRRIVELHGGSMEFHSTEGEGTQVCVHLKGAVSA